MAQGSNSRNGQKPRLIAIHTAEGARTVEALNAFFERVREGSSHAGVDDERLAFGGPWVPYDRASWTLRSGNPISLNIELCTFAKNTRKQWLEDHETMLKLTAQWVADMCRKFNIPAVKLSPADVKAGKAGIIGHVDWTNGMKEGSHWDPGPNFPWDEFMALVHKYLGDPSLTTESEDDELNSEEKGKLDAIYNHIMEQERPEGVTYSWSQAARNEALAAKQTAERIEAALMVPGAPYGWLAALNNKIDAIIGLTSNGAAPAQVAQAAADAKAIADELAKRLAD